MEVVVYLGVAGAIGLCCYSSYLFCKIRMNDEIRPRFQYFIPLPSAPPLEEEPTLLA